MHAIRLLAVIAILSPPFNGPPAEAAAPILTVTRLPELAGSTSVALDVRFSGPFDTVDVFVTGWSTDGAGLRKAVVWTGSGVPFQWEQTSVLPPLDPAADSWATASGDPLWPPNHKVGTAVSLGGVPKPVLWMKDSTGTNYQPPTVLPTLAGGTGEVLAISDDSSPRLAGSSTTGSGVEKAVLWSQDGSGIWSVMTLPHYAAGLSGRALGLCGPDTVRIVGHCVTAVGDTIPQAWLSTDAGITWSRTALPLPPFGTEGRANQIIITHTNFLTAAGWYDSPGGDRHAIRWESTDGGASWMPVDLGPAAGLSSSAANDFVLPDGTRFEAVGRSWSILTPSSGQASLWIDEGMGIMVHNLNDLVADSPGLDLRNAHGIVWDPDDDLRAIVGDGTDVTMSSAGRVTGPHAWVAMEVGPTAAVTPVDSGEPALQVSAAPNPFSDDTVVSFVTPARSLVRVTVRDIAGRRVATLAAGEREAGRHSVAWNGRDGHDRPVTPGVYLLEVAAGGESRTVKVARLR